MTFMDIGGRWGRKAYNNSMGENRGFYENDPEFREASRKLTGQLGNEIAVRRNRLLQSGVSMADADRMLMPMTIAGGGNFANLYDRQAARVQQIREQRRAERHNFWKQLGSSILGMGGGALIQAGLNKQMGSYMNAPDRKKVGSLGRLGRWGSYMDAPDGRRVGSLGGLGRWGSLINYYPKLGLGLQWDVPMFHPEDYDW